ncbi:MAG: DedA family protein [Alphaproteobacteria bacterium]|nr:DedA family protein [Alphaproteobacteria bacterium]
MLRGLYEWVMRLSGSPRAIYALFCIGFAESSFFPVPPDVMLAPMVLARPERTWRYALVCTVGSILGGMLGYWIGYTLTPLARELLSLAGMPGAEAALRAGFARWGAGIILIQGLLPIPYKLVTITTGLAHFTFWQFVLASCVTRSARFFGVSALVKRFGPTLLPVIERRLAAAAVAVVILAVLVYLGVRYIAAHT